MLGRRALQSVAVLACAGCVSVGAAAAAMSGSPSRLASPHFATARSRTPGRTTASNKLAAINDANELLQGVVPPSGAVLKSSGAATGPHAPLLTLAFASAVAYRSWTVPDDPTSVLSFVEAHLPAGSKVVSTGTGGPNPSSQSVIRSWPPVSGVLDNRWLEIDVTSRPSGGTLLHAESQSQWLVERPRDEKIPAGASEVDITSSWPGQAPFLSRRVTNKAQVHALVALFNSLERLQPGAINCPEETVTSIVRVGFRSGATSRLVAQASVSSAANFSWPASVPGWECFPVTFSVQGRNSSPLVGNVIAPIQRLLHVKLSQP